MGPVPLAFSGVSKAFGDSFISGAVRVLAEGRVVHCELLARRNFAKGEEVIILIAASVRRFRFVQEPCRGKSVEGCWAAVVLGEDD